MGRKKEKFYPARIVPLREDISISATTPCRFTVTIPLKLPNRLDPGFPAPPYYDDSDDNNLHDLHPRAMAVLRPILTGLLYTLWGTNTAVLSLIGPNSGLKQSYDSRIIRDGQYNLATGHWVDQLGVEGSEIEAYMDVGDNIIEVVEGFKFRIDIRLGKGGVDNPLVVDFRASENVQDGGAVLFYARVLEDDERKPFNDRVCRFDEVCGSRL